MENKKVYTKLSDLVDDSFTITKVWGYQFKLWDNESKRMLVSEKWEKGYRKIYGLDTSKGSLDLSASQLGQMLESVNKAGVADINGKTFNVKSNGKTGMDIRYYINPAPASQRAEPSKTDNVAEVVDGETINLDELGW